jgi:hypothetical protein
MEKSKKTKARDKRAQHSPSRTTTGTSRKDLTRSRHHKASPTKAMTKEAIVQAGVIARSGAAPIAGKGGLRSLFADAMANYEGIKALSERGRTDKMRQLLAKSQQTAIDFVKPVFRFIVNFSEVFKVFKPMILVLKENTCRKGPRKAGEKTWTQIVQEDFGITLRHMQNLIAQDQDVAAQKGLRKGAVGVQSAASALTGTKVQDTKKVADAKKVKNLNVSAKKPAASVRQPDEQQTSSNPEYTAGDYKAFIETERKSLLAVFGTIEDDQIYNRAIKAFIMMIHQLCGRDHQGRKTKTA